MLAFLLDDLCSSSGAYPFSEQETRQNSIHSDLRALRVRKAFHQMDDCDASAIEGLAIEPGVYARAALVTA